MLDEKDTDLDIISSDDESLDDPQINNLNDTSSSSQTDSDNNDCTTDIGFCYPSINVITSTDKKFLLDLIDKIPNDTTKTEYLLMLKDIILQKASVHEIKPFSFDEISNRFKKETPVTTQDLQVEIKQIKQDIKELQFQVQLLTQIEQENTSQLPTNDLEGTSEPVHTTEYIATISHIRYQRWYTYVYLHIHNEYKFESIALVDSGANQNCIREGLIPTEYFEKTKEELSSASGAKLQIKYKLTNTTICNKQICFKTTFILIKNLSQGIILGTQF